MRIRGAGTLGNNGALIIVDGVVGEINNLIALDIESVSVLKDAASAAIYGARAANGVVIIKTRRGRNTGGLKFTYDGYVAQQEAQDMPERVDIRTELNMVNWVYTSSGQAAKYSAGFIDSTESGIDPIKYPEHELARPDLQDGADVGPDGAPLGRQRPGDALAVGELLRSGRHPQHRELLQAVDTARQHELQHLQAAHGAGQPHADA